MYAKRDLAIWHALMQLEYEYWHDVDTNWGENAHAFYLDDGVFDMGMGSKPHCGSAAVQAFYAWRKARGARTARHLISNFQVRVSSEREATALCIMSLYAADGEPILPSRPPIMIADVINEYTRADDGRWHLRSRKLIPIFTGGEAPTIMTEK